MREEFLLDALVDYQIEPEDPTHTIPNPQRRALDKEIRAARWRRSPQKAWIVPIRASSSSSSARSSRSLLARCFRSSSLDLAPEAKLHLTGRLFGERDRDDPAESAGASADEPHDATDQSGCLAGSRRRLDKEARAELGQDSAACRSIGKIGHGDARTIRSRSEMFKRHTQRSSASGQSVRHRPLRRPPV
jgi:hypothetical protein